VQVAEKKNSKLLTLPGDNEVRRFSRTRPAVLETLSLAADDAGTQSTCFTTENILGRMDLFSIQNCVMSVSLATFRLPYTDSSSIYGQNGNFFLRQKVTFPFPWYDFHFPFHSHRRPANLFYFHGIPMGMWIPIPLHTSSLSVCLSYVVCVASVLWQNGWR